MHVAVFVSDEPHRPVQVERRGSASTNATPNSIGQLADSTLVGTQLAPRSKEAPEPSINRSRTPVVGTAVDTRSGYLPTLDGWRAIAISLVILDHAFNSTVCAAGSLRWCNRFMVGQTGVNLFFGISGFLITTRLLDESRRTHTMALREFYVRRVFRILPAALAYLGVIILVAATGAIIVSPREVLASLFFFRNYLGPQAGFYTTHFWSLSVEEQFYIVWPTVLILLLRLPRRWPVLCTIAMAVLVASWRQVAVMHDLSHYGRLDPGFFLRTGVRADGLLMGAALALALRAKTSWLESMPLVAWFGIVVVYVSVVLHFGLRATIWEASLVPLLIAWTAYHPRSTPSRVLEAPGIRWLGRLSYSLYLWQQPFFPPRGIAVGLPVAWKWPLEIAAAILCAVASFYLIERPAIRFGHRLAPPVTSGRGDI